MKTCDYKDFNIPEWLKKAKNIEDEPEELYGCGDDEVIEKVNQHVKKGSLRERLFFKKGKELIKNLPNDSKDQSEMEEE